MRKNLKIALRGLGVGLSICQKIVEEHHGRISARTEPGRGAVFTFVLPVNGGGELAIRLAKRGRS